MFNYNINPVDLSAFSRGIDQGQARSARKQASQQQQQIQSLTQAYLSGDQSALNQIAAISPQAAQQVMAVQQAQQPKQTKVDLTQLGSDLQQIKGLASGQSPMLGSALQSMTQKYQGTGFENDIAQWAQQYQQDPQGAIQALDATIGGLVQPSKGDTKSQQELDALTSSAGIKAGTQEYKDAALIKLGLKPRAVGSAAQTLADDPAQAAKVAEVEARITGRKKEAEILSRLKLEPQLEASLKSAVAKSASQAKQAEKNRSNDTAWNIYQSGVSNLTKALTGTSTGALMDIVPALTSEAKIAEGAIAIMGPILKDAVRSAGEGTWTDADQRLINNMIPNRGDSKEAISVKVKMLDDFMRSKLGVNQQPEQPQELQQPNTQQQSNTVNWSDL